MMKNSPTRIISQDFREVLQKASSALFLKVLAAIINFALYVVIARIYGPANAGIFFLALSIATLIAMASRVGLDNALVRFSAIAADRQNWSELSSLYRQSIGFSSIVSLSTTALLAIYANEIAGSIFSKPELGPYLRLIAVAIFPMTVANLHAQYLKGMKRITSAATLESVAIPLVCLCSVLIIGQRMGLSGAIISQATASVFALLLAIFLCRKHITSKASEGDSFSFAVLLKTSLPLFLISLFQIFSDRSSVLFLGALRTSGEVGIFEVSNRTSFLISFVLIAVNSIAAPKFAALYRSGDLASLENIARQCISLTAVTATPFFLLLVLFPEKILLLFGNGFSSGSTALIILAIGQFFNAAAGSVGALLVMTGNERMLFVLTIASTLLIIVLNLILIPEFGVVGASIALSLTLIFKNAIALHLVHGRIKIMTIPFFPRLQRNS